MDKVAIARLHAALCTKHKCEARWLKTVHVRETRDGAAIWDGDVEVFDVALPNARRAYAWSHEIEGSDARVHIVLGAAPIVSPADAVRAVLHDEDRLPH
ncbi:MAG TPA: hypothetical protein VGH28_25505 [Polyangiaceae bacterium]|jgi:hypothetical protein